MSVRVTTTWNGKEFMEKFKRGLVKVVDDMGRATLDRLRKNIAPPNNKPYDHSKAGEAYPRAGSPPALMNSTFKEVSKISDHVTRLQVGFSHIHGWYMEKGVSKRKAIYPKKPGGFLSWIGPDGKRVVVRFVKRPGDIAPRPFVEATYFTFRPVMRRIFVRGRYF